MAKVPWEDDANLVQRRRVESIARVQPPIPDIAYELPRNVTAIPRSLSTVRELEITESSPEDLVFSLATAKLTSSEVNSAFLRPAGLVFPVTVVDRSLTSKMRDMCR